MSLSEIKKQARRRAMAARKEACRIAGPDAADRLWRHLRPVLEGRPAGTVVSGYWPMGEEFDLGPALSGLDAEGFVCALPVVTPMGEPLVFRRWRPGDPLTPGPFGTRAPPETAPDVVPAVLLVPLLAFDRAGRRLGYGGGYYDRTLRGLRRAGEVLAIGIAFAAQEVIEVPAGPGDERLDWVVTEREAIEVPRC